MGSGQIYKGTQSFALYWVGAAAAATSASEQSSVRISVCQSVLFLLLLQPPLHILKTETFYFVANLFRFVFFVDVVVVGFLWLFELFLIYGDAKVFCCKMRSTFLLLRRRLCRCRLQPLLILHRSLTL